MSAVSQWQSNWTKKFSKESSCRSACPFCITNGCPAYSRVRGLLSTTHTGNFEHLGRTEMLKTAAAGCVSYRCRHWYTAGVEGLSSDVHVIASVMLSHHLRQSCTIGLSRSWATRRIGGSETCVGGRASMCSQHWCGLVFAQMNPDACWIGLQEAHAKCL
jgi:hypothetical protein